MTTNPHPPQLAVTGLSAHVTTGTISYGNLRFRCAMGRSGRSINKREGDGATPIGTFALRQAFYRADRIVRPRTGLPLRALRPDDGWCDDPLDRNYNRHVMHPYPASAEALWREDHLYDVVVVVGHNDDRRIRGRGSAIFMHVAREGFVPTEGCVAMRRADLLRLLERTSLGSSIRIFA